MISKYQQAINEGYSPEEINSYLSKKNPKYQEALNQGYTPEEIIDYLDKNKESVGANIGRQVGRGAARVAETALGAPRAFGEFLEGLVPEKAIKAGAEKIGLGQGVENLLENTKRFAPYKLFPKSEDIRENVTKTLFGKKLEPKNEWERKADDLVSDFTALALPFPGNKLKLLKPALVALGGTAASEAVGQLGGTEKQQRYGRIGGMLLASMANPKAAENLKDQLYADARKAKPLDAVVDARDLKNNIKNYRSELKKGGSAPYKTASLKKLDEMEEVTKKGQIPIEELEKFKISINSLRSGLYEEFKGNRAGRKLAKSSLDKVSNIVDKSLNEYGKINPEWEAYYRPANEVHGAIAQSHRARNWIGRHMKVIGFPTIAAELGLYHAGGVTGALTGIGAGIASLGATEILTRVMKSPNLRKRYVNIITGALKEDAVVVRENLKKLDEEIRKENQK